MAIKIDRTIRKVTFIYPDDPPLPFKVIKISLPYNKLEVYYSIGTTVNGQK